MHLYQSLSSDKIRFVHSSLCLRQVAKRPKRPTGQVAKRPDKEQNGKMAKRPSGQAAKGQTKNTTAKRPNVQVAKRPSDLAAKRPNKEQNGQTAMWPCQRGMGTTATVVYKRIASMIAEKQNKPYSKTIHWIRCRLNFSLLRSSIMCLRGSRSAHHRPAGPPITTNTMDLACSEGRVPGSSQD